ncbi:H3 protein, partial [Indicator maculatus]|nr:H3 protein [Indicator maculatus]
PSGLPTLRKKLLRRRKKRSELLLPAGAIRGLLRGLSGGAQVKGEAAAALQAGCEAQLLALFEALGLCALHAKRAAIHAADLNLVRCLQLRRG